MARSKSIQWCRYIFKINSIHMCLLLKSQRLAILNCERFELLVCYLGHFTCYPVHERALGKYKEIFSSLLQFLLNRAFGLLQINHAQRSVALGGKAAIVDLLGDQRTFLTLLLQFASNNNFKLELRDAKNCHKQ